MASNNGNWGVIANNSVSGAALAVMLRNVVVSYNGTGLYAELNTIIRVAHSVITGNNLGVNINGGTLDSYGDNDIDGNTTNNTGVLTEIPTN